MQIQSLLDIFPYFYNSPLSIFLLTFFINIVFNTILFIVASYKKDNSIIDIFYSWLFVLPVFSIILYSSIFIKNSINIFQIALSLLVFIWGARLSLRIYKKNKNKPEDFRYAAWRNVWLVKGKLYFYSRSYFQIFLLQALIASIIVLPAVYFMLSYNVFSVYVFIIALILWIIGFLFESVGDGQLDNFLKDKERSGKEKIMTTGLWKYTRHPNYFGEITMWWSVWIMAGAVPLLIISPLLITYLLKYVSGVPMLENRWDNHPDIETKNKWLDYKNKTPTIFPDIKNMFINTLKLLFL